MFKEVRSFSSLCRNGWTNTSPCRLSRFASILTKASASLDDDLLERVDQKEVKAKKHPGILPHGPYVLPDYVKIGIKNVLQEAPYKQLMTESRNFKRFLLARHGPIEREDLLKKQGDFQAEVEKSMPLDLDGLSEEDKKIYLLTKANRVNKLLKERIYKWSSLNFTHYLSLLYLVTRSAPEYAALSKVFNEIHFRTSFQPNSLFDFGSGIGSVFWAANSVWGKSIVEYYGIDSSSDMLDISGQIMKMCNNKKLMKGIFQRQFLPSSNEISADIVVSSYSLLELPSSKAREETIKNLWNRTARFLVLIELGSKAGFKVLSEARNFILSFNARENDENLKSHMFAPCPHELACPRVGTPNNCYFPVSYLTYPQKPETIGREHFSYCVFEKGLRDETDKAWPRIVQPVLQRSRHVVCRFCTSSGSLHEVIFTPTKHGKITYKCAKSSNWGDLFPCTIIQKKKESASDEGGDV